jgi:hypothetical protein
MAEVDLPFPPPRWTLLTKRFISSLSESSSLSLPFACSLLIDLVEVVWSAFYFCLSFSVCFSFFMLFSYFANPVNYCWFSSSFSINVVRLSVVKLLASLIVVTLGCHSLLKNLKIFLVATSLATGLPSPCKRFCQESESFFTFRRWFHHRPCEIIQTLELKHWS